MAAVRLAFLSQVQWRWALLALMLRPRCTRRGAQWARAVTQRGGLGPGRPATAACNEGGSAFSPQTKAQEPMEEDRTYAPLLRGQQQIRSCCTRGRIAWPRVSTPVRENHRDMTFVW